jgi:hypothetical protein
MDAEAIGRAMVAGWNDHDLDALLELTHPEVVHAPSRAVGSRTYHGHAGIRAWWEDMTRRGRWYEIAVSDVLMLVHGPRPAHGTGPTPHASTYLGQPPVAMDVDAPSQLSYVAVLGDYCLEDERLGPWTAIYTIADGLIIESQGYVSTRSQLQDLGIMSPDFARGLDSDTV